MIVDSEGLRRRDRSVVSIVDGCILVYLLSLSVHGGIAKASRGVMDGLQRAIAL